MPGFIGDMVDDVVVAGRLPGHSLVKCRCVMGYMCDLIDGVVARRRVCMAIR